MMKKIELKSRKLLRRIFGGISFTAVAFVFQACYGPRQEYDHEFYDIKVTGTVKSMTTNLPIEGIKVAVNKGLSCGFTDENGKFDFYTSVPDWEDYYIDSVHYTPDSVRIQFLDIDGLENGYFEDKTIFIASDKKREVRIDVELEEKQ